MAAASQGRRRALLLRRAMHCEHAQRRLGRSALASLAARSGARAGNSSAERARCEPLLQLLLYGGCQGHHPAHARPAESGRGAPLVPSPPVPHNDHRVERLTAGGSAFVARHAGRELYARGYGIAYCCLIAASVLLPSAKLYGLNIKIALALMLVAFGVVPWREILSKDDEVATFSRRYAALFAYFAALVACWSVVALKNGFTPLPEVRSMLGPATLIAG